MSDLPNIRPKGFPSVTKFCKFVKFGRRFCDDSADGSRIVAAILAMGCRCNVCCKDLYSPQRHKGHQDNIDSRVRNGLRPFSTRKGVCGRWRGRAVSRPYTQQEYGFFGTVGGLFVARKNSRMVSGRTTLSGGGFIRPHPTTVRSQAHSTISPLPQGEGL